ncbi:hypothetical protein O3M35_011965 [Rhynocoris fuscipes]|uniref:Uncharacterized protein n=1 Tax=Rhynocoris fuscipes TaxID=488301 RepID=A0AAW1CYJ1_9HEMI
MVSRTKPLSEMAELWDPRLPRKDTYYRQCYETKCVKQIKQFWNHTNYYWLQHRLNGTLLDYMREQDVPVWTFNVGSKNDKNLKIIFSKMIELIGWNTG